VATELATDAESSLLSFDSTSSSDFVARATLSKWVATVRWALQRYRLESAIAEANTGAKSAQSRPLGEAVPP
jgi:hypothetical protein